MMIVPRGSCQARLRTTFLGQTRNILRTSAARSCLQAYIYTIAPASFRTYTTERQFNGESIATYTPRKATSSGLAGSSLRDLDTDDLLQKHALPSRSDSQRRFDSVDGQRTTNGAFKSSSVPPKDGSIFKLKDSSIFKISDQVTEALKNGWPIVALETTIYTHGFPYPDNVELAKSLEDIVRENGAVPATIGIVDGVARVGLSEQELTDLCSRAGDPETMKVSRRDLPYILGMGLAGRKICGGTTISGTMFIATQAGIRVFGTGGLGGVHRGGEDTMDISADLTELGRTSMAVISSGCKSFLDIPRTLEYLETQGATVCTFSDGRKGQIDFPSFYTRDSGIKSPMVVQSVREAAAMIYAQEVLGRGKTSGLVRQSGILLANPISEEFSIPKEEIDVAINQAVREAAEQGFHGHANTPFILARIKDLTQGRSIPANRALIQRNVKIAAEVAVELANFRKSSRGVEVSRARNESAMSTTQRPRPMSVDLLGSELKEAMNSTQSSLASLTDQLSDLTGSHRSKGDQAPIPDRLIRSENPDIIDTDIVVLGSIALDLSCDYTPKGKGPGDITYSKKKTFDVVPEMHTSNIATITQSVGGVGHNVALAAHRAGSGLTIRLHSAVADDLAGNAILQVLGEEGLDISRIAVKRAIAGETNGPRTAQYVAVNDQKKDLVLAMADMSIFSNYTYRKKIMLETSPGLKWAVVDANWDSPFTRHLMKTFKSETTKVAFEPVSIAKAASIFEPSRALHKEKENKLTVFPYHKVDLATPNEHELNAMYHSARKHEFFQEKDWWRVIDSLGIPSTGARDRFVSLTSRELTDRGIPLQTIQLLPFIPTILTKLGSQGVLLTELLKPGDPRLTNPDSARWILSRCTNGNEEVGGVYMRLFPPAENVADEDIVSVNGVGDTFLGVLIAGLARGIKLGESLINIAQKGAVMTLKSKEAVSPHLGELSHELEELSRLTRT